MMNDTVSISSGEPTHRRMGLARLALVLALILPIVLRAQETPAAVAPSAGLGAIGVASGDGVPLNKYDAYFIEASATYAFPANLIKAVAWTEGGWAGTSVTGAIGIMQIMPIHWGTVARNVGHDIYTPRGNILMGTYILNYLLKTYGSYEMAVRRYLGVGVDPSTGITDTLYWSMVKTRWQALNANPVTVPMVNTDEQANGSLRGADPYRARDGQLSSTWYVDGTPPYAILEIDLGKTIRVSSIWWTFRITGAADSFAVRVSVDCRSWTTVGRFSNAPVKTWQSVTTAREARCVRLQFSNPNGDPVIGYVAELEVYGASRTTPTATAGTNKTPTKTATPRPTATGSPAATATGTPLPAACTASPNAARYLTKSTVACTGFRAGERVQIYWDTTGARALGSFTADGAGAGTGSFAFPEAPGGNHIVVARGDTSKRSVQIPVTVKPRATLSLTSGPKGARTTYILTGFKPGELVDIRWFSSASSSTLLVPNLVASQRGTVIYTFNVPADTAGSHKVEGRGGLKSSASAAFTLTGTIPSGRPQPAPPRARRPERRRPPVRRRRPQRRRPRRP